MPPYIFQLHEKLENAFVLVSVGVHVFQYLEHGLRRITVFEIDQETDGLPRFPSLRPDIIQQMMEKRLPHSLCQFFKYLHIPLLDDHLYEGFFSLLCQLAHKTDYLIHRFVVPEPDEGFTRRQRQLLFPVFKDVQKRRHRSSFSDLFKAVNGRESNPLLQLKDLQEHVHGPVVLEFAKGHYRCIPHVFIVVMYLLDQIRQ
ncbi:MAG: hypothetical protein A4E57_02461 [Syntrophorhabdaceae bacterium PtaU1.Bin034]|nr:MAG: hypothetical protein A4E57_02461 [Syntrophorhabdaceae bacterium PtaU1.Bin034]